MSIPAGAEGSLARDMMEQLAERLAERQDFSEILGREVRASVGRSRAFPADLNDADDLAIKQNRRTDHFLNRFGSFLGDSYAFKHRRVPRGGKIILDLGPAIAGGARSEGRIARQRNKTDLLQGFRHQKVQVPPARGKRQDGHFIIPNAQIFGDFLSHGRKRNLRLVPSFRAEGTGDAFHLRDQILCRAHSEWRNVGGLGQERFGPSVSHPTDAIFRHSCCCRKKISDRLFLQKEQSNLHTRNHVPILTAPRILNAPPESFNAIGWDLRGGEGMSSTATRPDTSYLLRKLHSFTGILPVGAFLAEHFWSNSSALVSAEKYNATSQELQTIPFRLIVEWGGIFLPMLFHGGYGIYILLRGTSNASAYPWVGNWLYATQRYTGIIAFAYIGWHLYTERWLTHGRSTYANVAEDMRNPWYLAFFVVGVLASSFHLGVGIWNFLCKWGLAATVKAQQAAGGLGALVGVAFTAGVILIILSFLLHWHPLSAYFPSK